MLDKPKGLTMVEKKDHVAKIVAKFATLEASLHAAQNAARQMEGLFKEARKLDIGGDFLVMQAISRVGVIGGDLAAAAVKTYDLHKDLTDHAKAEGIDTGGPLTVLRKFQPATTKDGGGSR